MKIRNLNQKTENNKPKPDEEDDLCWHEVLDGVKKIREPNIDLSRPELKPLTIRETVNVFEAYQGEGLNRLTPGTTDNIDFNTARRFKRGEFRIEAILDLHGMTSDAAYAAVESFMRKSYIRQLRCVQIVTGKGLHRDEEDIFAARGVLRDLVQQWLNGDQLRPLVLAYDYSRPEDGGDGALSVLLRRKRID